MDPTDHHSDQTLSRHQVRCLLDELCIRLGFCLPPADIAQLMENHPLDVEEFADDVFRREGLDVETADIRLWRSVRDTIQAHFNKTIDSRLGPNYPQNS